MILDDSSVHKLIVVIFLKFPIIKDYIKKVHCHVLKWVSMIILTWKNIWFDWLFSAKQHSVLNVVEHGIRTNIVSIFCRCQKMMPIWSVFFYYRTPFEMEPESNIKRCPRCRFPLEWVAGCAQIMCVNCKHIFCWYCLKSLDVSFSSSSVF